MPLSRGGPGAGAGARPGPSRSGQHLQQSGGRLRTGGPLRRRRVLLPASARHRRLAPRSEGPVRPDEFRQSQGVLRGARSAARRLARDRRPPERRGAPPRTTGIALDGASPTTVRRARSSGPEGGAATHGGTGSERRRPLRCLRDRPAIGRFVEFDAAVADRSTTIRAATLSTRDLRTLGVGSVEGAIAVCSRRTAAIRHAVRFAGTTPRATPSRHRRGRRRDCRCDCRRVVGTSVRHRDRLGSRSRVPRVGGHDVGRIRSCSGETTGSQPGSCAQRCVDCSVSGAGVRSVIVAQIPGRRRHRGSGSIQGADPTRGDFTNTHASRR